MVWTPLPSTYNMDFTILTAVIAFRTHASMLAPAIVSVPDKTSSLNSSAP